ncbi:MAG: peptidyl-prolyl cis-trans isomerase [Paracoccaceae bacterium]
MAARSSISKTLVWILMGLLFVGLAGFGATNLTGNVRTIGSVGDEPISVDDYSRALQNEMRAIQAETGEPMSFRAALEAGLDREVLSTLVTTAALDHEAGRLGLSVGDATLAQQLRDISAFQGADGSFDREAYRFALENNGLTEAQFEADLRDETARRVLQGAILSGTPVPDAFTETLLGFVGEQRRLTWARLDRAALDEPLPEPDEAELRAFHEENGDLFTRPETRQITYAWLTPDMILDTVEVDEEALRALYEDRADRYDQPERRLVERLVFSEEATAEEALARIEAGETDFEDLVEDRGLELADVDMGDVTRDDLDDAADGVFAADEGEVVGPLPSGVGPALFRVNTILAARSTPFDEVRDELRAELAADRARRVIETQAESFDDMLAGGATLEELAEDTEMRLDTIGWHSGMTDEIAAYEAFREAAREVEQDDYPEILQLDDGGIFALRLDEIRPPETRPFDEVEDEVARAWRQNELRDRLSARAEELIPQLSEGRNFDALGLDPIEAEGVLRSGFLPDAPEGLVETAFEMRSGEVRQVSDGDGVAILRLDEILPPDTDSEDITALRARIVDQAANGIAQDLFEIYARDIQARGGIEIDQQAIDAVHASFQ